MERLQSCERHAPQAAAHWYRAALFSLDIFSTSFGLFSSSLPLESEESGIVLPQVVVCHLYLR